MAFRDYSATPTANSALGDGTYIGPNMLRNKVRPALQQLAADGKELADYVDIALESIETGQVADLTLRPTLAGAGGSSLVNFSASAEGAVARNVLAKLRDTVSIEDFGALGDGVTLDDSAFAAAAASGVEVTLKPGATYYLSTGVACVSGTRFVCKGFATVKLKTGSGGFNSTDFTADKGAPARCVFYFASVDNIGMEGVRFTTDAAAERVIYPIRVVGGCATVGCDFKRIRFVGLSACNGGYLSLNSIGAGGYRVSDIEARDCGTALTTWTGTPQITVFEIDNDMLGGVNSEPGHFSDIRGINVLLAGAALTTYGQQTDVVNIAGGSTRKGPTGHNVYGDGCGEVIDLFCDYANITGVRGRNVRAIAKLVHGASYNTLRLVGESWSESAVEIAGSSNVGVGDTAYNTVIIETCGGGGTVGAAESQIILFQENGGITGKAKNNTVIVENAFVDASLDHLIKDNHASSGNDNRVEIRKLTGAPGGVAYDVSNATNVRASGPRGLVRLTMSATQTLTTGVGATVAFDTVATDLSGEAITASNKIRVKHPGRKLVRAQVRGSFDVNTRVMLEIMRNGAVVAFSNKPVQSGAESYTYNVETVVQITADQADRADADLSVRATLTGTGTLQLQNTATATFFELVDLG